MSFGKDAGGDAAGLQAAANLQGINEIRRQFDITSENVDPFISAGQDALGSVVQGSTASGFGDRLSEIFSGGALEPLLADRIRDTEGNLAARGLNRSGAGLQGLADVRSDFALGIEDLLFNRQAGLSEGGRNSALQLGSLGQGAASNIANLFSNTGSAQSSGLLLDRQTEAASIEQAGQAVATVLPLIFGSDPDLKENIEEIGEIKFEDDSKSLKIYQWDWVEGTEDTFIEVCPNMGFMADEVEQKYPERVEMFGSYKMIAYFDLLDDLKAHNDYQLEAA